MLVPSHSERRGHAGGTSKLERLNQRQFISLAGHITFPSVREGYIGA